MLSMPYAVALGGWASLAALVVAAALFCLSGLLIVKNFDKVPAGMPHTYPALGAGPVRALHASGGIACDAPAHCCMPPRFAYKSSKGCACEQTPQALLCKHSPCCCSSVSYGQ